MKRAPSFLICLLVLSTTACNTLVTRREMFRPKRGSGYWTDKEEAREKKEGIFGVSRTDPRGFTSEESSNRGIFGISHSRSQELDSSSEDMNRDRGVFGISHSENH